MFREFELKDRDFSWVCETVQAATGIQLSEKKRDLVYNRVARRIRTLGLADFEVYRSLVESREDEELEALINALTTNVTAFFREPHHFEFLEDTVLPAFQKRSGTQPRLRIWSAGCSSGEEPYTIGMTLRSALSEHALRDAKILATDLDTDVLDRASAGVYTEAAVADVPKALLKANFHRGKGAAQGKVRVRPELRELITFRQLNLIQPPYPFSGKFDVIFCRNVVIYFDKPTQSALFRRFASMLQPGGFLCIGHSETVSDCGDLLEGHGRAVYRRR